MKNVFLLLLLISFNVFAGNERGNGGSSVVCFKNIDIANKVKVNYFDSSFEHNGKDPIEDIPNSSILSVELLDLYENKHSIKELSSSNYLDGIAEVEYRYSKFSSLLNTILKRGGSYERSRKAYQSWDFTEDYITPSFDTKSKILIPRNCIIFQIANHKLIKKEKPLFKISIHKRLFNLMSTTHQTALIVHEYVIQSLLRNYENLTFEKTKAARVLTSSLFLEEMSSLILKDYFLEENQETSKVFNLTNRYFIERSIVEKIGGNNCIVYDIIFCEKESVIRLSSGKELSLNRFTKERSNWYVFADKVGYTVFSTTNFENELDYEFKDNFFKIKSFAYNKKEKKFYVNKIENIRKGFNLKWKNFILRDEVEITFDIRKNISKLNCEGSIDCIQWYYFKDSNKSDFIDWFDIRTQKGFGLDSLILEKKTRTSSGAKISRDVYSYGHFTAQRNYLRSSKIDFRMYTARKLNLRAGTKKCPELSILYYNLQGEPNKCTFTKRSLVRGISKEFTRKL